MSDPLFPREAAPSRPETLRALMEKLALEYHKADEGEGEYGCPGLSCPGVQRLTAFGLRCVSTADAAALAGPQAPSGWHPIETAPKDGTLITVYSPSAGSSVVRGAPGRVWRTESGREVMRPTHWMPLPASPAASTEHK
jgi:hypothetical protein